MPPEIKKEVSDMIVYEATFNGEEVSTDMMTEASMGVFEQVWNTPEDEHWDEFIKNRLHV